GNGWLVCNGHSTKCRWRQPLGLNWFDLVKNVSLACSQQGGIRVRGDSAAVFCAEVFRRPPNDGSFGLRSRAQRRERRCAHLGGSPECPSKRIWGNASRC